MFAKPDYVFKDGELVVKDGKVVKVVWGATHVVKPSFDVGVEKGLKEYFDQYHTIQCDHFKIANDEITEDGRGKLTIHEYKTHESKARAN
jgi:formylmethanofuran dehydrogenase subunit A